MYKLKILVLMTLLLTVCYNSFSRKSEVIMRSNSKVVKIKVAGNVGQIDWTLTPEAKPDVFDMYDPTAKVKNVKFVSDVDSIEFKVKLNKPVYFSIVRDKDTAQTCIDFNNRLPNRLSKADKLMALGVLWSETKYNFVFYDKLKFSWDSLYKAYIPKIAATDNDIDFYDLMGEFVGSLQDGHSQVYTPNYSAYRDYISFGASYFNDTLRLILVRRDLESIYPVGSKIIGINGMSADEYMDKYINPFVDSDFKPTQQILAASRLFSSRKLDDKLTIKYITPNGELRENTPPRDGRRNRSNLVGYKRDGSWVPIDIKWEKDGIAVLTINTFNDRDGRLINHFEEIKDTLYSAKGIVVDIRKNGGGGTDVAWYFLKHIIKDSCFLNYGWQTRINDGVGRANGNWIDEYKDYYDMCAYRTEQPETICTEDSIKKFDVPIVVLISNMTCSAAEDFLIILYERHDRPLLIGQPSFGSTGSPLMLWDWPDEKGGGRICTRRVLFPYSMKPFDKGIEPDILVKYSFEEFMNGEDKDIEVALKEIQKQINNNSELVE